MTTPQTVVEWTKANYTAHDYEGAQEWDVKTLPNEPDVYILKPQIMSNDVYLYKKHFSK